MRESGKGWEDLPEDPMRICDMLSLSCKAPISFFSLVAFCMKDYTADDYIECFDAMGVRSISEACQILSCLKKTGTISQKRADKACKYVIKNSDTCAWQIGCIAWPCHVMTPAKFAARVPAS